MNARLTAFWEQAAAGATASAVFCLPLAFHLEAYDAGAVKSALLLAAGLLALISLGGRAVESGRVEVPANRAAAAACALLILGGAFALSARHTDPLLLLREAQWLLAGAGLFLVVLIGPASISFSVSLIDAALAAGALSGLYAASQMLGVDPLPWRGAYAGAFAAMGEPAALGAFLGALFPLGLARGADEGASGLGRLAARAAALLCVLGVLAAAAPAGFLVLWLAAGAFGVFGLTVLRREERRAEAFAALAVIALTAWSAVRGGAFDAAPRWNVPQAPAAAAGLLALWALAAAALDARRRAAEGEEREPMLIAGQWASLAALAALPAAAPANPAGFGLTLIFAAALLGLAKERGAAIVRVLPLPAPPLLRRFAYAPLALLLFAGGWWSWQTVKLNVAFNRGVASAQRGDWKTARPHLEAAAKPWHPRGLEAYFLTARALEETGEAPLALLRDHYYEVAKHRPRRLRADYRLARTQQRLGDWSAAYASYKNAVAARPGDLAAWRELSETALLAGKPEESLKAAVMLAALAPDDAKNWHFLSERYAQMGRKKIARRILQRAERVHAVAEARRQRRATPL